MKQNKGYGTLGMWHILFPILAYAGVYYLVEILGTILVFMASVLTIKGAGKALDMYVLSEQMMVILSSYEYEMSALASLVSIPISVHFIRKDRIIFADRRYDYRNVRLLYYPVAGILGAASCLVLNNMMAISGIASSYSEEIMQVTSVMYRGRLIVELIGIGVIAPIAEEMVFRGLVMERIRDMFDPNIAIIFSSVIFGCYHGNMIQALYAGILGLILGFVYDRYRDLKAPILVHAGANMISVIGTETAVLDGLYQTDTLLFLMTGIWCLVVLGCLWLVNSKVQPELILRDSGEQQEEQ